MTVLVVGSIGLDTVETPFGKKIDILGGSGIHASVAASFYGPTAVVGVAGSDFPKKHLDFLASRQIDTRGIQILPGETFRWSGYYEKDMNQAHTRDTRLNVYSLFNPQLPNDFKAADYVFLANLDPELQLKVIAQLDRPKFIAMDTMNFWIENKKEVLVEVIKKVDLVLMNEGEARQFMGTSNLPAAAKGLLKLGAKTVIIKKGEHGALLFSKTHHFAAPSYPQEMLRDPTGAGDSFAGGLIGYLAKTDDLSDQNMRRAIIVGSVMASYNVEDFSLDRMRSLKKQDVVSRFKELKQFSEFGLMTV